MGADRTRTEMDGASPRRMIPAAAPRRLTLFAATAMLLGFVVSILALETVLRLLPPAWLEQRMRELNAGEPYQAGTDQGWPIVIEGRAFRQFVPGSSFTVSHAEYRHGVTIDELGGRATPHNADATGFVPFMGDSFTFGVGVEDHETFVSLIAAEAESPRRLLNLGVTGTALHNQLDTLELRHDELGRPAFYVFSLFMGNDLTNIRRHYQGSAIDASTPGGPRRRRWLWQANIFVYNHPLLKQLYAIQFLRQKALRVMNRGDDGFMDPVFLGMRTDLDYLESSLAFLRRELARLTDVSNRLGFDVVFILIPDVRQLDASRRAGKARSLGLDPETLDPDRITRAISQALNEVEIPYLDLGPCLLEAAVDTLYYTKDNHFTAAGHALAARCILESRLLHVLTAPPPDRSSPPLAGRKTMPQAGLSPR